MIYNDVRDEIKVAAGQKGGRSKSDAKRASSRANLLKARLKRWPGRELARAVVEEAQNEQHVADGRESV